MGFVLYAKRIGGYLEEKYYGRFGEWKFELCNSKGVFIRLEERIW